MEGIYQNGLVTIGFPVRNGAARMRPALESLLNQTYRHTEIIISDNASTDDTEKICREYAARDARVRYIRQKDNISSVPNIEFVMRAAHGEYFMLGADDDWWHPEFIEKLKATLDAHLSYDIAMSSVRYVTPAGVLIKDVLNIGEHDHTHKSYGQVFSTMSKRGSIHYILGLYRTQLLHNLLRQPFPICIRPDRVFLSEVAFATRIYSLSEILYHRTAYETAASERYSMEPVGKQYRNPKSYTKFVWSVVRRLICSANIPFHRKLIWFPLYMPKFLWTWRKALVKEWI